jgi:glycosyltransferase involved in cell wall biosynthesis
LIENGVDLDRFKPAEDKPRTGRILFLASLDYYLNQDALDYFLRRIMHLISRRFPAAKLQVVGKGSPLELKKRLMQCAGVEFVGEVGDVRPYLAKAAVVVVPLRVGGGSRIKILEALAMGKPVVSTSIGAEGLALSDGVHIALADTPTEFAARTVELLRSHEECQRLGENGRRLVIERYSWDRAANNLDSAWQEVCRPRRDCQTANSQRDQLELPLTVNGQL